MINNFVKFPRVSEIFGVKKPLAPHNGKTGTGNGGEEPDVGRGRCMLLF